MELVHMISQHCRESASEERDRSGKFAPQFASSIYNGFGFNEHAAPYPSTCSRYEFGEVALPPLRLKAFPPITINPPRQLSSKAADAFLKAKTTRIPNGYQPIANVRSFIGGLSHCYNNLLTGIWGYASLIAMSLDSSDPFQDWMTQLEEFIQNGSNLLHLLFGYIAERRAPARQLRLQQLAIELEACHKICGAGNDLSVIESCVAELPNCKTRPQLACSIARVIEQMHFLLYQKRSFVDPSSLRASKAMAHLEKIDGLLDRGSNLILKLQYYAGVRIPIKHAICLRSLVRHRVNAAALHKPALNLKFKDSTPIARINADSQQIGHALDQLISNAHQAVSEGGKIEIELNTQDSEPPIDRCGVHMLRNYAVITVRDTGRGMTTSFQSKVFEPFFTGIKGQGRSGLGLSAAAGIVRAHGGYIQVRSKTGGGSAFKMYLPAG